MSELINDQFICFCCRNTGCDSYTIFRGYLICEYCLDNYLDRLSPSEISDFELFCRHHKRELDNEAEVANKDSIADKSEVKDNSIKQLLDKDYPKTKEWLKEKHDFDRDKFTSAVLGSGV